MTKSNQLKAELLKKIINARLTQDERQAVVKKVQEIFSNRT